jgi:glycosyltransferase involved in cell wall biosynthesis
MSGGELALLRLLPHLSNVEPHVILAEDGPLADALVAQGISVEVMPMAARARDARKATMRVGRVSPFAIAGSAMYTVRIARRLRALRPDLVHTNSLKAGVYGGIAARTAGVPMIWHVHDRIATDYLPAPAVVAVRFLISRLATGCIANSQATLLALGTSVRAVVLPSAVPEMISGTPANAAWARRGATVFGIIGRLAPWKGQDVFLRAFARAFPDGEQRAMVVGAAMFGDEDERYAAGLVDLVRELGITERVEFRGFRNDVGAELARMDVLVHASTIPEPFGQVVVEGMASGLAVVASAEGGPLEIITPGVDGELVPPGDVERLATLLAELDGDPVRRSRLGAAALPRARDFLPENIVARLEDFYGSTMGSHSSSIDADLVPDSVSGDLRR